MTYEDCHKTLIDNYSNLFSNDSNSCNYNDFLNWLVDYFHGKHDDVLMLLLFDDTQGHIVDVINAYRHGYENGYDHMVHQNMEHD